MSHYVYRCYDADGDLIYIGVTKNVARRMASHRAGRAKASRLLVSFMERYEVSAPYPTRDAAEEAERHAIRLEQPIFNTQERGIGWTRTNEVARYLVERDRRDLAIDLACACWRETRDAGQRDSFCVAHANTELEVAA